MAPLPQFLRERDEPRLQDGVPVVRVARHPEHRQMVRDPYGEVAPRFSRKSELALHLGQVTRRRLGLALFTLYLASTLYHAFFALGEMTVSVFGTFDQCARSTC